MIDLPGMLDAKQTGPIQWKARCPSHDDKSPSLAIKDAGDRWLIHCHAGCTSIEVCHALSLEYADLFHDRIVRGSEFNDLPRLSARDRLNAIAHEVLVALMIVGDVLEKRIVSEATFDRLAQASVRINAARPKS